MITTITAKDFNRDPSFAKRKSADSTVIITERGEPSNVMLNYQEYKKLTATTKNVLDVLGMPEASEIDFVIPVNNDLTIAASF